MSRLAGPLALFALLATPVIAATPVDELVVAAAGRALVDVIVAAEASPAEHTAAAELATYLSRITGASFEPLPESSSRPGVPAIFVGPTARARSRDPAPESLGPEEWVLRGDSTALLLYGGRPRGTLYAVYRLLEEHLGVHWWTPYEESVPHDADLTLPRIRERGRPGFLYRDVHGIDGPREFNARNRVNGHFSLLGAEHGGREAYGPPRHVHNFYEYVPPEEHFDSHPEYFSELDGMRFGGAAQLCLSQEALVELVARRMTAYIEQGRSAAQRAGEAPPRLYAFSQNDWGKACSCDACSATAREQGSQAGPLVAFVNRVAQRIAGKYPEVLIDTLAYHYTLAPPAELRTAPNVVVRIAGLYGRDFSKPARDPANREYHEALTAWVERTDHARVWDYIVIFGGDGELPLPNLSVIAADLAEYRRMGIEGVFVQDAFPIAGDLRDLKTWMLFKLLEDPTRDARQLLETFTDGFYGAAGPTIRAYVELLRRAAVRRPAPIRYASEAQAYAYLDREFLISAHRLFDLAGSRVRGDAVRLRRVDHARLSLDRATLILGSQRRGAPGLPLPVDRARLIRRYRRAWYTQIDLRLPQAGREAARAEVDREIAWYSPDDPVRKGVAPDPKRATFSGWQR